MIDLSKHIIFCKKSKFLQELLIQQFVTQGMSGSDVHYMQKKQKETTFTEELFQKPLLGAYTLGIQDALPGDYSNDAYSFYIDRFNQSSHAYLVFLFDRLPGRLSAKVKNGVAFRDDLTQDECEELLSNYLTILRKKVSSDARKFLLQQMQQNPEAVLPTLSKIAAYVPHLYLDAQIIRNSFDITISPFQTPELFLRSRGLQSSRILDKVEYEQFRPLFLQYLMHLIQFKIGEKLSIGEKMRIIKAHPQVIEKFTQTVKPYTLLTLQRMFLYYSAAARYDKDIFIIKHLTRPKM